jgi:hypothetical protein
MTTAQRAEQVQPRGALYNYVNEIWEATDKTGGNPAQYDAVAAIWELTSDLWLHVTVVQHELDGLRGSESPHSQVASGHPAEQPH